MEKEARNLHLDPEHKDLLDGLGLLDVFETLDEFYAEGTTENPLAEIQAFLDSLEGSKFVVFDTETTGLDPATSQIAQIAAVSTSYNGKEFVIEDTYNKICKLGKEGPGQDGLVHLLADIAFNFLERYAVDAAGEASERGNSAWLEKGGKGKGPKKMYLPATGKVEEALQGLAKISPHINKHLTDIVLDLIEDAETLQQIDQLEESGAPQKKIEGLAFRHGFKKNKDGSWITTSDYWGPLINLERSFKEIGALSFDKSTLGPMVYLLPGGTAIHRAPEALQRIILPFIQDPYKWVSENVEGNPMKGVEGKIDLASEAEALTEFLDFLEKHSSGIVAHNSAFDIKMVQGRLNALALLDETPGAQKDLLQGGRPIRSLKVPGKHLDTLTLARKIFTPLLRAVESLDLEDFEEALNEKFKGSNPERIKAKATLVKKELKNMLEALKNYSGNVGHTLGALMGAFGRKAEGWHSALEDVKMTIDVFNQMLDFSQKQLERLRWFSESAQQKIFKVLEEAQKENNAAKYRLSDIKKQEKLNKYKDYTDKKLGRT